MRQRLPAAKPTIAFLHDVLVAALSFALSLHLRVGGDIGYYQHLLPWGALLFALVAAVVFRVMGLYRGVWRYASVNDLLAIARAATVAILVFLPLMFLVTRLESLPRSVPLINWFVLMALLGGPRFLYRLLKDRRRASRLTTARRRRIPVLLVGCDDAAELFIRATRQDADAEYEAVGMVSEKPGRVGRNIHGVGVLGTVDEIPAVVHRLAERRHRPHRLVVASDNVGAAELRTLMDIAEGLGMTVARLPRMTDFRDVGEGGAATVRPIALEDLLGRPQAVLDRAPVQALVRGRRVLVTGAGGSIGAELVRQVADLEPARLALFDSSEYALYSIDLEMAESHPGLERAALIGDVRDRRRLAEVMSAERPELVFHAAALKHVPLVEANPVEGVLTNAAGSRNVADACLTHGVGTMVLISTDKAVNPTNVMGASKRIAESYCQALDLAGGDTRFVTVRFGNVLGSTGSVVPLFKRQLAAGGPLTVTHPDMVRYFMTIREAVELVLQASAFARGSDVQGRICVLDMGQPVRILDLARQMIRLAGLRPDIDMGIEFTGLRPGEKLFEEIFHGAEPPVPTACDGVLLAAARAGQHDVLAGELAALEAACTARDAARVLDIVRRLVPEYAPAGPDSDETGRPPARKIPSVVKT